MDGRTTSVQQSAITTYVNGVASASPVTPFMLTGYDTFGEKVEAEDPDGNITATAYDQDSRVTDVTAPSYT